LSSPARLGAGGTRGVAKPQEGNPAAQRPASAQLLRTPCEAADPKEKLAQEDDGVAEEPTSLKEYAAVIRDRVRHENELTNQRLTWMSTLNGLMPTGLGFIWGKHYDQQVIPVFCVLGVVICFSAYLSLRAAEDARYYLYSRGRRRASRRQTSRL
jgi:hypothetical protein